jgi:hypothetical protein
MSSRSKREKNSQYNKKDVDPGFMERFKYIRSKIFIPYSNLSGKIQCSNSHILTKRHLEQLKKELK